MIINLFGASNSGKSYLASEIYARLKEKHYNIELVREGCKLMAYRGENIYGWKQLYVFTEQIKQEQNWIEAGVEHIITDSPILLGALYGYMFNRTAREEILNMACEYMEENKSINFFIDRDPQRIPFSNFGRFDESADAITEKRLKSLVAAFTDNVYTGLTAFDSVKILEIIESEINNV
jgi:adenylate kinase family enzyme